MQKKMDLESSLNGIEAFIHSGNARYITRLDHLRERLVNSYFREDMRRKLEESHQSFHEYAKKKLHQAITISLLVGIFFTMLFMTIPDILLKFIYNTTQGVDYIRIVAPLFLMHYIQGPLTSYMQAANMAKDAMLGTLKGTIIKNILLVILPIYMGMWGLIIISIINIFFVTIHHIYHVRKSFR